MSPRWVVPATAAVAHASTLGGGLVWLDHAHIEERAAVAPPGQWLELFRTGFAGTGYYRPLTALGLSLEALAGGALVHHAANLLLHALAALLVVAAAEVLGLARRAALIAGLLFAVHPLGSLVVSAIAFRSESLVVIALLALVWAHVRERPIVAGMALLAGALAKETVLVLGPAFALALGILARPRPRPSPQLLLAELVAFATAVGMRLAWAPAWRAVHPALGPGDAIGTRLAALAKSAYRIAIPVDASICDAFSVRSWWSPESVAGAAVVAGLAWLAVRRRGPALLLALAVLPCLQLVPVMRWWSPHYAHVALVFVAMLAAEAIDALGTNACRMALGIIALLGGLSFHRDRRFRSDEALWSREVAAEPACREGQFYLGEAARAAGRFAVASARYEAALASRPGVLAYVDRLAALQNLGVARVELEQWPAACAAFRAVLDALPPGADERTRREVTHDLALATLRAGDPTEAAALLEAESLRSDALPASILLRAAALERIGRHGEAEVLRGRLSSPR